MDAVGTATECVVVVQLVASDLNAIATDSAQVKLQYFAFVAGYKVEAFAFPVVAAIAGPV